MRNPLIQFTVPVKNEVGQLRRLALALEKARVVVLGLSWTAEGEAGFIRFVSDDPAATSKALEELGWNATQTPVLSASAPASPGELARMLKILDDGAVSLQEMYGTCSRSGVRTLVLSVDRLERAEKLLEAFSQTEELTAR